MSSLVLELKSGDMMVINGAAIRFRTKTRLELASHARFLFGKQLMSPAEATTTARRIYCALQSAYIGTDAERPAALKSAQKLISMFRDATTSPTARLILDEIASAANSDQCYQALKLTRRIIRHEDAVLAESKSADIHAEEEMDVCIGAALAGHVSELRAEIGVSAVMGAAD